jgi:hypothetical protein
VNPANRNQALSNDKFRKCIKESHPELIEWIEDPKTASKEAKSVAVDSSSGTSQAPQSSNPLPFDSISRQEELPPPSDYSEDPSITEEQCAPLTDEQFPDQTAKEAIDPTPAVHSSAHSFKKKIRTLKDLQKSIELSKGKPHSLEWIRKYSKSLLSTDEKSVPTRF